MPEYLAPGVFVEEIPSGPRPIEGVPTSTAGFVGETERGPASPRLVTSSVEYEHTFGSAFAADRYLPHAVRGFFENGGTRLYVARVTGADAATAWKTVAGLNVRASGPGAWGNRVWVRLLPGGTDDTTFTLHLAYWSDSNPVGFDPFDPANDALLPRPQHQEAFEHLSTDALSPNHYSTRVKSSLAALVSIVDDGLSLTQPTPGEFLDHGRDSIAPPSASDFAGDIDSQVGRLEPQGLAALALDDCRDVALVYAPFPAGDASKTIPKLIVQHCEAHRFRFAVIDSPNVDPMTLHPRDPSTGIADTQYAAVYAPWLIVADPPSGANLILPPGGYVTGIYARVDTERGVFKAPANEEVRGAIDLAYAVTNEMQSELNPRGVNVIRAFAGRGIRVWGARTLSSDTEWKYVPVRRYFIFLERSISEGTEWVVFEPNDERLWQRVRDTIRLFLRAQWLGGGLFGVTEQQAFFVKCDRTTMTQDDIENGRLICLIGIAPVRAAEFVIFRIFQHTAEAS